MKLFAEAIHVDGFAPLNFLSGGNFPDGGTWSDNDATADVLRAGAHTASWIWLMVLGPAYS
ncbi:hypothetical protein [Henriciella marina]|uniref:hypothetical protein n=1 Tax=Henriciella marina TaxID=453851 RepID=UPI00036735CF|nr:hypothetical protein [Henriciella marina]